MPVTSNATRMAAAEKAMGGVEDLDAPSNKLGIGGKVGEGLGKLEGAGAVSQVAGIGKGFAQGLRENAQRAKETLDFKGPEVIDQGTSLQDMLALLEG